MAPPPFVRAVAYGLYEGRIRAAIHALKYDGLHPVAHELGFMLAKAIAQLEADVAAGMLVVPIPLHRSRYAQRGFNQTDLLAQRALKALRKSRPEWKLTFAPRMLVRKRATESQAGLSSRQRRLNVRTAFAVTNPAVVRDRDVLVVDDILTTGATARAAAKVLMDCGAASVRIATLARAQSLHPWRAGDEIFFDGATADQNTPALQPLEDF